MSGRGRRQTDDGCSETEFIVRLPEAASAKGERRSATREHRGGNRYERSEFRWGDWRDCWRRSVAEQAAGVPVRGIYSSSLVGKNPRHRIPDWVELLAFGVTARGWTPSHTRLLHQL